MVKVQNSSDLDRGRRPELKSDEFWTFTTMVTEKMRPEVTTFPKKVIHLSVDHSSVDTNTNDTVT